MVIIIINLNWQAIHDCRCAPAKRMENQYGISHKVLQTKHNQECPCYRARGSARKLMTGSEEVRLRDHIRRTVKIPQFVKTTRDRMRWDSAQWGGQRDAKIKAGYQINGSICFCRCDHAFANWGCSSDYTTLLQLVVCTDNNSSVATTI